VTELYFALLAPPKLVSPDEFPLAFNTVNCSVFFHVADYWSPIPDEYFPHREHTNRWVWLMSVFLLAHEMGHVMKKHFDDALARNEGAGVDDDDPAALLRREHREEFEADEYAIELMLEGERHGGLVRPGANRESFWGGAYSTLGWLFSTLEAIEILSRRLDLSSTDKHPPAAATATPLFEVPVEELKLFQSALAEGDGERIQKLLDLSPALKAFANLPETALTLVRSASPLEAMQILQSHPELLIPTGDKVLADLAANQAGEVAKRTVEIFRLIVARCRESGVLLANIMTPSETSAGLVVLEADDGGAFYARELSEHPGGAGPRYRMQRPPWSFDEWLGRPLEVTIYTRPGAEVPLAYVTPAGFFWYVPPSSPPDEVTPRP